VQSAIFFRLSIIVIMLVLAWMAVPQALISFSPSVRMYSNGALVERNSMINLLARRPPKNPPRGGSGSGFGAPKPPEKSLEEVVAAWPSRLPADATVCCPCGSGDAYADCCQPYHKGEKTVESPERCLRTRYSAFAYRLPLYIIDSTDKTNRDYQKDKIKWAKFLNREQMFDSFRFDGLEVGELEAGANDDEQFLSLRVTLMPIDDATKLQAQPEPLVFNERSKFLRNKKGTWLYAAGDVKSSAVGFKDRTLKDEKDLAKMEKDVEYVNKLIKDKTGKN
jgi:SEC-C motif domain protein